MDATSSLPASWRRASRCSRRARDETAAAGTVGNRPKDSARKRMHPRSVTLEGNGNRWVLALPLAVRKNQQKGFYRICALLSRTRLPRRSVSRRGRPVGGWREGPNFHRRLEGDWGGARSDLPLRRNPVRRDLVTSAPEWRRFRRSCCRAGNVPPQKMLPTIDSLSVSFLGSGSLCRQKHQG